LQYGPFFGYTGIYIGWNPQLSWRVRGTWSHFSPACIAR
jgi:hypothetical protein